MCICVALQNMLLHIPFVWPALILEMLQVYVPQIFNLYLQIKATGTVGLPPRGAPRQIVVNSKNSKEEKTNKINDSGMNEGNKRQAKERTLVVSRSTH